MMDKMVKLIILLFATLSGGEPKDMNPAEPCRTLQLTAAPCCLTILGPTSALVLKLTNVSADKMTSVPKLLVERAKGTVMMILNVKDHLFVDTSFAWIVQ